MANVYYKVSGDYVYYSNEQKTGYSLGWPETSPRPSYQKIIVIESNPFVLPEDSHGLCRASYNTTFDVSTWDTSACTNISGMFASCYNLTILDASMGDTSNVTDASSMFLLDSELTSVNVSHWDTTSLEYCYKMFKDCPKLTTINMGDGEVHTIKRTDEMFSGDTLLKDVYTHPLYNWKDECGALENSANMFYGCTSIYYYNPNKVDITNARPGYYFVADPRTRVYLKSAEAGTYYMSNNPELQIGQAYAEEGKWDPEDPMTEGRYIIIELTDDKFIFPEDATGLFYGATNECFNNVGDGDTSTCTNMSYLFCECRNLKNEATGINPWDHYEETIYFDVFGFDTSNVTDMSHMFENCKSIETLTTYGFDTSNVTDMSWMFGVSDIYEPFNSLQTIYVNDFDTSKVTNMRGMLTGSPLTNTDLVLTNWDTSNVTDMSLMFSTIRSDVDVSSFNTSKVTDMRGMFSGTAGISMLDVSHFDTGQADCSGMFTGTGAGQIDLGDFDLSSTTDLHSMFYDCSNLQSIIAPAGSDGLRDYPDLAPGVDMFTGCVSLPNGDGDTSINRANNIKSNGYFTVGQMYWKLYQIYQKESNVWFLQDVHIKENGVWEEIEEVYK